MRQSLGAGGFGGHSVIEGGWAIRDALDSDISRRSEVGGPHHFQQ
jgi:hypothetical protein